jgi:hypothetical protein
MTSQARDWMAAASCSEGPRPTIRFADLPRQHQHEILRLTATAAGSIAFFIAVSVIPRTLSSRSLVSGVVLLDPPARTAVLDPPARPAGLTSPAPTPPPAAHGHARLSGRSQTANTPPPAAEEPVAIETPAIPPPERHRNPLSRLVRAVFRTGPSVAPPDR